MKKGDLVTPVEALRSSFIRIGIICEISDDHLAFVLWSSHGKVSKGWWPMTKIKSLDYL